MATNGSNARRFSAKRVASMGLLFALAMALSFLEGMLPVLPGLPPGVKLGLSNIVTMYCLFFLGGKDAYSMALLKSLFVLLTRGPVAATMSLAGGLTSVTMMLVLLSIKKLDLSYLALSILGAVSHNVGQLVMSRWIVNSTFAYYYLPIMVVSGVGMGIVTGAILRVMLPYMKKLSRS